MIDIDNFIDRKQLGNKKTDQKNSRRISRWQTAGAVGDNLTSKTTIELINNTGAAVTGTVKIFVDGALKKTIGPVPMPPNTVTYIDASETTAGILVVHEIKAEVEVRDGTGKIIGQGLNRHIYTRIGSGGI